MKRREDGYQELGSSGSDLHPPSEEILRLVDGGADAWQAEQIQKHLDGCAACGDLARDLAGFPDLTPPGDAFRVDEHEVERALGALRRRILASEAILDRPSGPRPAIPLWPAGSRGWPLQSPRAWPLLVAVALALVLVGAGAFWRSHQARLSKLQARLERAESALRSPLANVQIAVLLASDDSWRTPEEPGIAGGSGVLVLLQSEELLPPGAISAEIRTVPGGLVLRIDSLVARPTGVTFFLPPNRLPPGDYDVRLVLGSGEVLPTSYSLTIGDQPEQL